MRPVPVPKQVAAEDWVIDTRVFAAPDGDLTNPNIAPVEAVVYKRADGEMCVGVVLMIEEEDMERIEDGARHLLMSWPNALPVFMTPVVFKVE